MNTMVLGGGEIIHRSGRLRWAIMAVLTRINITYEAWPGKSCTLLIFSLFDALSPLNFSNTFRNSNSVKRGAYK